MVLRIIVSLFLIHSPLMAMDNPKAQLKAVLEKVKTDIFGSSSFLSLRSSHHPVEVHNKLQMVHASRAEGIEAPVAQQKEGISRIFSLASTQGPAATTLPALPELPVGDAQQQEMGDVLQAAQAAEQYLQANPSSTAKYLRLAIAAGMVIISAADLALNYGYLTYKNPTTGQEVTSGTFTVTEDLGILSFGGYQGYLALTNWDTTTKQNEAAVATALVQTNPPPAVPSNP